MFWILLIVLFVNPGCVSVSNPDEQGSTPEQILFQKAKRLKDKSYYKEALSEFKEFKTRYLYSPLVSEADLAIADIYFFQDEWAQAARNYKSFSELYPQHSQIDRAMFQMALSYYHQLPTTPDRDLSLASKVIQHFDQHLRLFPKSSYRKESLQYKNKILYLQAQKQWISAQFHIHRGRPSSALPYLNTLLKTYPKSSPEQDILPSKEDLIELIKEIKTDESLSTEYQLINSIEFI